MKKINKIYFYFAIILGILKNKIEKRKNKLSQSKEIKFVENNNDSTIMQYYIDYGLSKKSFYKWLDLCVEDMLVILAMIDTDEIGQSIILRRDYLPATKQMVIYQRIIFDSIQCDVAKLENKDIDCQMVKRFKAYIKSAQNIVWDNIKNNKRNDEKIVITINETYKSFYDFVFNKKSSLRNKLRTKLRAELYHLKSFGRKYTIINLFIMGVMFAIGQITILFIQFAILLIEEVYRYYTYRFVSIAILDAKETKKLIALAEKCKSDRDQMRLVHRNNIIAIKVMILRNKIKSNAQVSIAEMKNDNLNLMLIDTKRGACPKAQKIMFC